MPTSAHLRPGSCVRRGDEPRRRSIGIRPYQVGWSVIGVSAAVVRGNALVPRRAISAGWCARPLTPSVGNATGLVAARDPGRRSLVGSGPNRLPIPCPDPVTQCNGAPAGPGAARRFPVALSSMTKNGRCWRPPVSGRGMRSSRRSAASAVGPDPTLAGGLKKGRWQCRRPFAVHAGGAILRSPWPGPQPGRRSRPGSVRAGPAWRLRAGPAIRRRPASIRR